VLKYCLAFSFLVSLGMSLRFRLNGINAFSVLGASWVTQSSLPGGSMFSQTAIHLGTAFYVATLCVNILVILFIILQLLFAIPRNLLNTPAPSLPLLPLVVIFSLSGLLYFVCALLFIIIYAIGNPINQVFMCICRTFASSHLSAMSDQWRT
jgi:hypothetical protein